MKNFAQFALSANEQKNVKGGVPLEEYCHTLSMIMSCNENTIEMSASWGMHCTAVNSERLWQGECDG